MALAGSPSPTCTPFAILVWLNWSNRGKAMTVIGAYAAKTHFPQLLRRAARGEKIVITKRGRPVAMRGPAEVERKPDVSEVLRQMRELRKGVTLGPDLTIRELIEEGRR